MIYHDNCALYYTDPRRHPQPAERDHLRVQLRADGREGGNNDDDSNNKKKKTNNDDSSNITTTTTDNSNDNNNHNNNIHIVYVYIINKTVNE